MACYLQKTAGQLAEEREREVQEALKRLEVELAAGKATVVIGTDGAICFNGWEDQDRVGLSDTCAYDLLTQEGSWELQQAVATAETLYGVQVNPQAVAAGQHSHDGGQTWSKH